MTETAHAGPLNVAWIADSERLEAYGLTSGLLVVPEQTGEGETHRVYFVASDAEALAKLCALPLALALDSGVWPIACKIVRDNPDEGERRHNLPPAPTPARPNVSRRSRMLIDALVTAVAAGARSTDGSQVRSMQVAVGALAQHVGKLERRSA